MVLVVKNVNICGAHWKIWFLEGGLPKKGGLGQFADLGGAWQERGGGGFEGGVDTPMHTMVDF